MLNFHRFRLQQDGAALLLMLLVLIIFLGTFAIYSSDDGEQIQISQREKTARSLALAKERLLSFILIDAIKVPAQATPRIGEFPCPDRDNEGHSNGSTSCQNIGWFPWKTLELEDLRDSSGSNLWYAVAPDFQDSGDRSAEPQLNSQTWDTLGYFRLKDINNVEHKVAAVIISPGAALAAQNQSRSSSDNVASTVIGEYLEGENSNGDDLFIEPIQPGENDQLVYITVDEVKEAVTDLVMRTIAAMLRDYYNSYNFYPFPEFDTKCDNLTAGTADKAGMLPLFLDGGCPYAQVLNMPAWFKYSTLGSDPDNNPAEEDGSGWDDLIVYMVAPACAGSGAVNCSGGGGLLTLDGQTGIQVMIADSGSPLNNISCNGSSFNQANPRVKLTVGSATPANRLCQFLDTTESTNDDAVFSEPAVSATMNDRFLIVSP